MDEEVQRHRVRLGKVDENVLALLRRLDERARLGGSVGRRGQLRRLGITAETDAVSREAGLGLDDAREIRLAFTRLMGDRLTLNEGDYETSGSRIQPFDQSRRSPRSVQRGDSASREARVDIIERLWEAKRRRHDHSRVSHRIFAADAVWSQAASVAIQKTLGIAMMSSPGRPAHGVILEHVVPADTVSVLVADLLRRAYRDRGLRMVDETAVDQALADLLAGVVTQVVITTSEDAEHLDRSMSLSDEQVLRDHFSGRHPLSADALITARWSRYLWPTAPTKTPFPLQHLQIGYSVVEG